ncbi:MAG TPA: DUF3048 domain-containing protein [Candidatus Saccharimonadales bacterium]|nr:DUF3048 domain-containing protein [Candidatus Saccharimonadales bacterium]
MDNFLPRRRQHQDNLVTPSKNAAAHTERNLGPMPTDTEASDIVVGTHLHAPKQKKSFKEWLRSITKKQWIIIGVVAGVLVIGGGIGLFFLLKDDKKPVVVEQKEEVPPPPPEPTTVASNLTGLQVDKSVNERPVTGIMIENSMDARPQSGLLGAGVVFEAVAEGGITRCLTLFQDSEPDYIGPVRSVRPYYIQWALGFDAAIAHAGGSADGLNLLKSTGAKDLNHNSNYFWRVNNRTAPHNLYTSIAKLREYEAHKGYGKANYTSLARKAEAPNAAPTAKKIDFNISSANFNVHYDYDATTNTYKRSEGGKAHTDERSGTQLSPKVVVGLIMAQGKSGIYSTYGTIGSGEVVVFQDGIATEGTWKKDSNTTNFSFTDKNGNALALNPGQTWFTVVGGRDRITFAP